MFPIDRETTRYLELSGRSAEQIALVEAYARAQNLWREDGQPEPLYSDVLDLDLGTVEPSLAGPKRPQDRIPLKSAQATYRKHSAELRGADASERAATVDSDGETYQLQDGAALIAAVTSCTNTSNPSVMVAAGLLARNARERGLNSQPWVKTSLAPGSKVVTDYLEKTGLLTDLAALGFDIVGYGCTTCIGNSGPLKPEISAAVKENDLIGCSVLSGNRNYEGRIHPLTVMNYLASPPLVVAYALAGSMNVDLVQDSLGDDADGKPVYLKDIWPSQADVQELVLKTVNRSMFRDSYASVFAGDENWNEIDVPEGEIYSWDGASTYVKNPPYFDGMSMQPEPVANIESARLLALLGDSVTTDHISPAGSIAVDSPAGQYLVDQGVPPTEFNSYGSRRGNHEVMMRGTFANIRLRNQLAPGTEGGWTVHQPSGEQMTIYDAAMRYQQEGTSLLVIAGKDYGSGSSRDWAAKGTLLLGVKAVLVESFERIHRSNLIGMGVLPLQFPDGDSAASLGLTATDTFSIMGLDGGDASEVTVVVTAENGDTQEFGARVRIDTPKERDYYKNGGILQYVLRQIAAAA
jgi:aconitate hydratase